MIIGGLRGMPAGAVADVARFVQREADGLRRLLTTPPRGDSAQCVNLVVPPSALACAGGNGT